MVNWLVAERTAGPSTTLRSGRDDNFVEGGGWGEALVAYEENRRSLGFAPTARRGRRDDKDGAVFPWSIG
jgi:hypothetical protein